MYSKTVFLKLIRRIAALQSVSILLARLLMFKAQLAKSIGYTKKKPVIVVLSLGTKGHSYSAAHGVRALGFKVILICKDSVLQELIYSNYLLDLDPLEDTAQVIEILRNFQVSGVVVSIKHVLLPAQVEISESLGCISAGHKSAELSNDKLAWRHALNQAGIKQPKFSEDRNVILDVAVVQKPITGTGSKGVVFLSAGQGAQPELVPTNDRSVGQDLYFEEFISGDHYDVEEFSKDGEHTVLIVAKMWFSQLDASGIVNGAWHLEGRLRDDDFLPIDFSNRMTYERFVSKASGLNFGSLHVSAFVEQAKPKEIANPVLLLQFFADNEEEHQHILDILHEFSSNVFDVRLEPFQMSTVTYQGMIVVEAKDNDEMQRIAGRLMDPLHST